MTAPNREDSYIGEKRSILIWVGAAIQQLHVWETALATDFVRSWKKEPADGRVLWNIYIHHHFLIVALNHMLTALDAATGKGIYHIKIDPTVRAEIRETRDLLEHWKENAPIFNTHPRPKQPKHPSGKNWANRNPPPARPYSAIRWDNKAGPRITPNITSAAIWDILNKIISDLRATDGAKWDAFLPEPQPRAWLEHEAPSKGWWPDPRFNDPHS